jgi:hypothetical protein
VKQLAPRSFVVAVIVASALALFANPAHATSYTLTCGMPTNVAAQPINLVVLNGASGTEVPVTIPAGISASQKCSTIADALTGHLGVISAIATGNTLTVDTVDALLISSDFTGESNQLSAPLFGGQLARLVEIPQASPSIVPLAGTTFGSSFSTPAFGPFTFNVSADGTKSEVTLLGQLNSQITTDTGLSFTPFTIPTGPTLSITAFQSSLFDPSSVSITWDANTGLDLANFGLVVEPASVPEPTSFLLLGTGLAAVARRRFKGRL